MARLRLSGRDCSRAGGRNLTQLFLQRFGRAKVTAYTAALAATEETNGQPLVAHGFVGLGHALIVYQAAEEAQLGKSGSAANNKGAPT